MIGSFSDYFHGVQFRILFKQRDIGKNVKAAFFSPSTREVFIKWSGILEAGIKKQRVVISCGQTLFR